MEPQHNGKTIFKKNLQQKENGVGTKGFEVNNMYDCVQTIKP